MYQRIQSKKHKKQHLSSKSPPVCGVPLPLIKLHEDGSNHSHQEECDSHLFVMLRISRASLTVIFIIFLRHDMEKGLGRVPIKVVTKRGKPTLRASQPPSKFSSTTSWNWPHWADIVSTWPVGTHNRARMYFAGNDIQIISHYFSKVFLLVLFHGFQASFFYISYIIYSGLDRVIMSCMTRV